MLEEWKIGMYEEWKDGRLVNSSPLATACSNSSLGSDKPHHICQSMMSAFVKENLFVRKFFYG